MTNILHSRIDRRRMILAAGAATVGATLPFSVHAQPALRILNSVDTMGPEPEGADFYRMSLAPDGRAMLTIRNHAPPAPRCGI